MTRMSQPRPSNVSDSHSLSFIEYLQHRLRHTPPSQKGERTRERLVIATASILQAKGYHAMRIADITKAAGLPVGSFYVYFKDKKEASLTALSAFLRDFVDQSAPPEAVGTPFESFRSANLRWFAINRANAGLMRCVSQLADEDEEFAKLDQRTTCETYLRVSRTVRLELGNADGKTLLFAIYFMGSMMDEIVRKYIIKPDREFHNLLRSWNADDKAIADAASLIWIRMFDPQATPPTDLSPVATNLARMMWGEPKNSSPARKPRK
jgi:TetR/AcrR family transcriptional repressor of nem operon